jgi:hypothetical protein
VLAMLRRHWDERVSYEGGLALLWMDGLLLIPLIMAAFFYPLEALMAVGAVLLISLLAYEGYVVWHKRHARPHV